MTAYRDDWIFPLEPAEFRISSGFGPRTHPITGDPQFHNGIDVPAAEGTAIVAPFEGEIRTWEHEHGGKSISITRDDGWRVGIAHLKDWHVRVGRVPQGALIGFVGSSGRSTGAHAHITVRKGPRPPAEWQDPAPFFIPDGASEPARYPSSIRETPTASIGGKEASKAGILAAVLGALWLLLRR